MNILLNHFSDTAEVGLLTAYPLTYLLHIADEYWTGTGFSAYLYEYYGIELPRERFVRLQTLGLLLMSLGAGLSLTYRFPNTMLAIFAGIVLVNCCVHSVRSMRISHAEPGLPTALLLWLPLGCLTLLHVWFNMSTLRFSLTILLGVAISGIVEVITKRGGSLIFRGR